MNHKDPSGTAAVGCECGPEGMPCSPCVARLGSPAERMTALRAAITHESEPLVTLTHLLHLCRDEHRVLWEQVSDPANINALAGVVNKITALLPKEADTMVLDEPVRLALVAVLEPSEQIPPVLVAHALAQLLDDRYSHTFADSFRRRSPYQPGVGDPIPLGGPDLKRVMDMHPTSPPWRLANRLDETRHLRLAGEWAVEYQVVFDYSLFDPLTGLITADTVIATCHPNRTLDEFNLPAETSKPSFPVQPIDVDRQRREINQLIGAAVAEGAGIVVLPELCITESLAAELHDWVRRADGPRLLVAGTYHHLDQTPAGCSPPRRRNSAVTWVRGHNEPLRHDKHSPGDHPIVEDIQPQGWPELRVYVTADGWHLMIAICRDLLNPQAVYALTEVGVNLLLVPAMSETLVPFGGPTAHLVGSAQALIAVANNPADWSQKSDRIAKAPARALFGHPGLSQLTRFVHAPDAEPGAALLHVGSGRIRWLPAASSATKGKTANRNPQWSLPQGDTPGWIRRLATEMRDPGQLAQFPVQPVTLRPAAVLVLFTDGSAEPRLLLTERAADLRDYPGQLVFPGGATEPNDQGPVATALREAYEEVGLDPDSVHIIGMLPAVAVPESRFLVAPVVAWSLRPTFSHTPNPGEVVTVRHIGLRQLASRQYRRAGTGRSGSPASTPDAAELGRMTATIIDTLVAMIGSEACHGDDDPRAVN
jgi:8-oxo-dGTP pyrophosphatase MutT (NUDIX family)